ncbi:MAG: YDG domain-containing protein, partial [Desulfurivibrionaceae bacterium]
MSRTFFLAWNKRQSAPAPETARPHTKRTGGGLLLSHLALALIFPACALALPNGGQISAGSGDIGQSGSTLTVTQTSPKLAINWQGFNIGQSETVNFNQPGTGAIALNRVLGQAPSQILGNLRANGQVFVLNPNGVLFGHTAQVNVNGLVASSLNLNDADFLAGNYTFRNSGAAGSVVNQGALTAANGGYLALLAPEARNEGVISATLGTALLAAGDTVTLHLNNGSLLSYTIDQGTLNGLAENKYLIQADGGQVILSARAADVLTRSVVNNSGIIEAHTIENQGGVIKLLGDRQGGQTSVSGTLDASGRNGGEIGGTVKVLGDRIALFDSARIDVSGASGGGTALIGGNFQGKGPEPNATATFVAQGAQLNADALTNGNGGKVVTWANAATDFKGAISVRGGAQGGNGGKVEVSGKQLALGGTIDIGAAAGTGGQILFDPVDFAIDAGAATTIVTSLSSGGTVDVAASNSITVNAAIDSHTQMSVATLNFKDENTDNNLTVNLNAAITLGTNQSLTGDGTTVNVNSPAASIQNGVDVAANSATVNVAAGTYMLNTRLDVNKPLTLRGAQHGIDPRTAAASRTAGSGAETIVDGNNSLPILLRIGSNNVTVDGFEFRNGTGDLIDSNVSINAPNVRYNLVHHSTGDEGVQIRYSTGAILEYNRVYDTMGDGLNISNSSTNGTIRYNEVHDNYSENAAIYVYGSTNTTIQDNYVHNVYLNANGHGGNGIKMGDTSGADQALLPGGLISGNVVANTDGDGITVYTSGVTVSGNQVSNSRSQDGAIFVYYDVDNVAIANNTISNSGVTSDGGITYAIRVGSGTKFPTNVTVTGNTFSNNEAQFFDNNGSGQIATIFGANTFDRSAMVSGDNRIWSNIQDGINITAIGNTVTVGAGTYSEAVNISTNNVTIKLAGNTTINSLADTAASTFVNLQSFALTNGDTTSTQYDGAISGTGSLTKQGSGTFTLSGANSYDGGTTINGGTLSISADNNLGAAPVAPTPGFLTLNNGTLQTTADVALDTNRGIALTGAGAFDTAAATTLSISGIIDGAGTLTKTGTGTLTLSGVNTYTGATTINAGTLSLSGDGLGTDSNLGAVPGSPTPGHLTLNNGTLQTTAKVTLNANRGIALTGAGIFDIAALSDTFIFGVIAGAGTLTKTGPGLLTLAGVNTYTGATSISGGTLLIGNDTGLGTAPGTTTPGHLTFNGGTLQMYNFPPSTVAVNTNRGIALMAGGGEIEIGSGNTMTYAGIIAGSGALSKGLDGTLELSGANSYTGLTTVSAGTLRLTGGAAIADTGAMDLNTSGAVLRLLANETVGSLTGIAGTSVIFQNNSTLTTGDTGNTTFAGVMSGPGGNLSKQGAGTFTLSGLNTYTGLTTVNQGTLAYGITNALDAGALTVDGGTLDIGTFSDTVAAVTLASGSITGTTGVLTGTSYGVQSGTISAILAGTGTLSKTTAGTTVTLSGANTYTGATTVSAGTLVAANAAALGSTAGSTTVANGATLEIANVAIGNETVTLNGTGIGGAGALTGSGTASLSGPVTLATASALGAAAGNALTLSNTIEGAGALDVLGGGTVTLGGTVGSNTALASFSTAAGTALTVNGGLLKTTGAQTYGGATTFGGATTLRTTAGGTVSAPGIVTATAGMLTLDTGAGDATLTNSGNDFSTVAATSTKNISLVDANGLTLAGIDATGLVDVRTQTGDLTLISAIATTSTNANAVTLVADAAATPNATGSGGNFKNNAGAAAITTGNGGAWRIYTGNPTGTTRNGLAEGGKRYNVDDGSDPLASGNRLYFRIQPTLALTADNKTKTYGDVNPAFTYSYAGLIDSDLIGGAISSGPGYTVDGTTSTSGQLTAATLHNITPSAATASSLGYSLSYTNGALTVTQKALTISATGVNKVYDGGTEATVTYSDNRVTGDLLTIGGTAAFLNKNVGTGKFVNVTDITLANTDAGNYIFNTSASTSADITAANLAVTGVTAANKVYDGTTDATLGGTAAITALSGDTVTLGGTGSGVFADKNVATGKSVTVSGYSISGLDAGNYALLQPTGVTANISARPLTISATGVNKVYDGTTAATVVYGDNRVAGDLLTIGGTVSYLDKNVGTGKTVNVSSITLNNTDAGNYTFNTTAATIADITARTLTIAATGVAKVYDGTTATTVTYTDNRVAGDLLTIGGTASYLDKNIGTGKPVNVSDIILSNTDADNYTFNTTATTTADISARPLTISATGINKVYDGTTAATVAYGDNRVTGDLLTIGGTAAYLDKNV